MKRMPSSGYTIIEVMIFLAISSALLGSTVGAITAQNNRTQFNQAVISVQQQIEDVLNDVETGYYPNNDNVACSLVGTTGIAITNAAKTQGTNADCTFIGKAFQFAPNNDKTKVDIYSIAGKRTTGTGPAVRQVASVQESTPKAIRFNVDSFNLYGGIEVKKIASPGQPSTNGFVSISSFGQTSAVNKSVDSSGTRASLGYVPGTFGEGSPLFLERLDAPGTLKSPDIFDKSVNGILVCLQETGGGRQAAVRISGAGRTTAETILDDIPAECVS